MSTSGTTPGRIVIIAGFALSCFGLLLFLWLAFGGPIPLKPEGYRFKASFDDATTLAKQADVRVAGVTVGTVVGMKPDPAGNRTLATIQLDSEYVPLRRNARAILRTKTLLGETYVEMTLGSPDAPAIPEGGRLPDSQIAPAVDFDELLQIFDPETRKAFQQWQRTLAEGTAGRAADLNNALGNLPGFVEEFGGTIDTLNDRRRPLRNLIRNTGRTFEAVTRDSGALRTLVVQNTRVMETLASRREALAETIQVFPTFLRESRAMLRRLETFADDTDPLIRDLEPVLEDAQPTLASLRRLAPDAEQLFRDLDPLIDAADVGFPALARVLRGLEPTLAATGPFLQQLNPILQFSELYQATISDFINIGPSALAMTVPPPPGDAGSETNGHALPQLVVLGEQSFPTLTRSPENRGNAYMSPNAYSNPRYKDGYYILPNWDCRHIGGPRKADEQTPGCFVQRSIPFQCGIWRYPHVEEALRGGRAKCDTDPIPRGTGGGSGRGGTGLGRTPNFTG